MSAHHIAIIRGHVHKKITAMVAHGAKSYWCTEIKLLTPLNKVIIRGVGAGGAGGAPASPPQYSDWGAEPPQYLPSNITSETSK